MLHCVVEWCCCVVCGEADLWVWVVCRWLDGREWTLCSLFPFFGSRSHPTDLTLPNFLLCFMLAALLSGCSSLTTASTPPPALASQLKQQAAGHQNSHHLVLFNRRPRTASEVSERAGWLQWLCQTHTHAADAVQATKTGPIGL